MNTVTRTLFAIIAVIVAGVAANAQDSQIAAPERDVTETSDARIFEQTDENRETFRSPGEITHQGGEAVYNSVCAGCHMPEGEGAVGAGDYPALADNELLASASYPIYLIIEGQRGMPPLGEFLDDQQIADVVNYIRSNFGNAFLDEYGEATADDVAGTRP